MGLRLGLRRKDDRMDMGLALMIAIGIAVLLLAWVIAR
jgi:hypothetical protein